MEALLEKFAVESWREHYIDYEQLNLQVEKIRFAIDGEDIYRDLERSLFNELDRQVQKLNKFSRIAQNFFSARIALLETRLEEFINTDTQKTRSQKQKAPSPTLPTSQTSSTSSPKSTSSSISDTSSSTPSSTSSLSPKSLSVDIPRQIPSRNISSALIEETASSLPFKPCGTPEEDKQLQPNLIQFDTLVCGRGLLNLEDFANINHTGFEQVLDNYEAATGKSAEFYMERVEKATFYENAPYESLCSQLEAINQQLRGVFKKTKRMKPILQETQERCARAYSVTTNEEKHSSELICLSDEEKDEQYFSPSPLDGLSATYFVHSFVAASHEDNIPTSKRQNMEFWRQCRRLDGIQFEIPVPRESHVEKNEVKDKKFSFNDQWALFALMTVFVASTVYLMYSYM